LSLVIEDHAMKSPVFFAAAFAVMASAGAVAAQEVNVYTYREPDLIKPLFEAFTKETGVKVNIVFAKEGLEERIASEGAASPADMLLTVDVARLTKAVDLGFAEPIQSDILTSRIPAELRDAGNAWFGISMRARVIYASKERIGDEPIFYEDLADPKFKGKICIRDGQHIYNNALFSAFLSRNGDEAARAWLTGLRDNLARKPSGGDRDVAKDIAAGVCDIGIGNTYYVGLMTNNPDQKAWADAVKVVMPRFKTGGTHVNVSGFVITKTAPNKANAIKLGEWLAGDTAQGLYATSNFEYPVVADIKSAPLVEGWGKLERDGTALSDIAKNRKAASELVDALRFNDGPGS
jgi:iron(III) transport system substrate-binding protein